MVLRFTAVSNSFLQASITPFHLNYTAQQLFISTAFRISLHPFIELTQVSPFPSVDRIFGVPITVEFRNIRSPLFVPKDWCVGQLTSSGWTCVSDIQKQPDGKYPHRVRVTCRLVGAIPSTGVFTVFYRIPVATKEKMSEATMNTVRVRWSCDAQISALIVLVVCYIIVLLPLLGILAYLLKYRARLRRADALLREDSALKSNAQEIRYNPMFTRSYIEFIDGDEKKEMREQNTILKQQDAINLLEEEIREARVRVKREGDG